MTTQTSPKPILVVSGEPSGDRAAADVVRILDAIGAFTFFGMGGDALKTAGVDIIADIRELSVMGIKDTFAAFGKLCKSWYSLRQAVNAYAPEAALLVDSPDLNLPLARILSEAGVKVVQYVGPQVWAWRKGRLGLLKARVRNTALVLPFEKALYDAAQVPARYVGHPVMDLPIPNLMRKHALWSALGLGPDKKLIALLPGSRPGEGTRHLGPMREAATRLAEDGVRAVLAPHPNLSTPEIPEAAVLPEGFTARELLSIADAALIASGTATLEAAALGTPMAVIYRTDPLTHFFARYLLELPYVSLPNWIAGTHAVPEILQRDARGETLHRAALALLAPEEQARQRDVLDDITRALGPPGCAARVAEMVSEQFS